MKKCEQHGKYRCRECSRQIFCSHNRQRSVCRECCGSQICEHNRQRYRCSRCNPAATFKCYQRSAKKRGYTFTLTLDQFKLIVFAPCIYCGENQEPRGVDRWNNSIGYESYNCVSCCGHCNSIKRTMNGKEFIIKCNRVSGYALVEEDLK